MRAEGQFIGAGPRAARQELLVILEQCRFPCLRWVVRIHRLPPLTIESQPLTVHAQPALSRAAKVAQLMGNRAEGPLKAPTGRRLAEGAL